jgi:hypothetical protein
MEDDTMRGSGFVMRSMSYGLCLVAAAMLATGCADKKTGVEQAPCDAAAGKTIERHELVTLSATVAAVDVEKRMLSLEDEMGHVFTFRVDDSVKRLDEIEVGDEIVTDFYVSLAAEIREPTAEEKDSPLVIVEGAGRASADAPPAAGAGRVIKAVVTVEGLDRPARLLTVKGPRGNYLTIRVKDVANLKKLSLGDTIVVTYTEALAISVEKAK